MSTVKNRIVEYLITRSFATKTAILVIGTGVILLGTELRSDYPVIGTLVLVAGLMTDWGVVWIVYIEITRIRDVIEDAQSDIQSATRQIQEAEREIQDTKRDIDSTKREVDNTKSEVDQAKNEIDYIKEQTLESPIRSIKSRLEEIERDLYGRRR